MTDTAPYKQTIIEQHSTINVDNIDMEKINSFNQKISVCATCEKCIESNSVPGCSILNIPLVVAIEQASCPIGVW